MCGQWKKKLEDLKNAYKKVSDEIKSYTAIHSFLKEQRLER